MTAWSQAEVLNSGGECGCDFESGGFRLLRGGMIEFKETNRWVGGVKAAGEGIETGAEDDDLFETGKKSGGDASFEPTFAGEVVGDDTGKDELFARAKKRPGPRVASGKFKPRAAPNPGEQGFDWGGSLRRARAAAAEHRTRRAKCSGR